MTSIYDTLKALSKIPACKEHISLLEAQLSKLEKEKVDLEEENAQLKETINKMKIELAKLSVHEEFVEHRGAVFKRKPKGGYHLAVYCPECHISTSSLENFFPYHCDRCGWNATFGERQLESIIKELP